MHQNNIILFYLFLTLAHQNNLKTLYQYIFEIVVQMFYKITFCLKVLQNEFFLIFLNQHIKIIRKIKKKTLI